MKLQVDMTNANVVGLYPEETDVPTWIAFEKTSLLPGDYANLGEVLFHLHQITLCINGPEACIEEYSDEALYGDEAPTPSNDLETSTKR